LEGERAGEVWGGVSFGGAISFGGAVWGGDSFGGALDSEELDGDREAGWLSRGEVFGEDEGGVASFELELE